MRWRGSVVATTGILATAGIVWWLKTVPREAPEPASTAQVSAPAAPRVAPPPPTIPPKAASDVKTAASSRSAWLQAANDPALIERTYDDLHRKMLQRYGPLLAKLGLSAEKQEAFIKLLIADRQVAVDLRVSDLQQGSDPDADPQAFARRVADGRAEVQDEIASLLGDGNYAEYKDYDRSATRANTLATFNAILKEQSAEPLTDAQSQQFQQLLVSLNLGHVNPRMLAATKSFLTPAQQTAMEELYAEQQSAAQRRANRGVPDAGNLGK